MADPTLTREQLDEHFRLHYCVSLAELEITETPGYWQRKQPCGGAGQCPEPVHGTLFNEGSIRHTVSYFDPARVGNRFASPTRTWKKFKETEREEGPAHHPAHVPGDR